MSVSSFDTAGEMRFSSLGEYFERLLLFCMKPEKARAAAQRLSDEYAVADAVLSSSVGELMRIAGVPRDTALLIKLIASAESRRCRERVRLGRVYDRDTVFQYVSALFIGAECERVYLASFDKSGAITGCDFICEGTVSASDIIPRMLLTTAVKRGAHSVIVAHNHPRGSAKPSKEDIESTERLRNAFTASGIDFLGHLVVAGVEHTFIEAGEQSPV